MKRSTVVLMVLVWLGFVLRVWNLAGQSFWWDEAFTWQATSHGWDNLWHMLQTGDRNPPLYFLSLMAWGGIAGWSEFSLRFLSVIYGILGAAFLAKLARRLFSVRASASTLALATLSPALVLYSQEARAYALFFAGAMASVHFGLGLLESGLKPRRRLWLFLVSEAVLLLTHYFAVPLVAAFNVCMLIRLERRQARVHDYAAWIGGQVFAALPLLLWTILVFRTPGSLTAATELRPDLVEWLRQALVLWLTGVRDLDGQQTAIVWAGVLGLIGVAIGAGPRDRGRTLSVLSFGLLSLMIAFGLTSVITAYHPRYVLPYGAVWWVLIGAALTTDDGRQTPGGRKLVSRIVGGLTVLMSMAALFMGWSEISDPAYAKDDARSLAAYLKANATADDVILVEASDYTLDYYDHGLAQTKMITATTETDALSQLNAAIGDHVRVWHVHWRTSTQDQRGYWPFLLEQSGSLRDWTSYRGYELYRYDMQAALHHPSVTVRPFQAADSLLHRWSGIEGQGSDGALAFAIEWPEWAGSSESLGISLRLKDVHGSVISSRDSRLGSFVNNLDSTGPLTRYYVLPIPPGTAPLSYTLVVLPYRDFRMGEEAILDEIIPLPRRLDIADPYRTLNGYKWQTPASGAVFPGLQLEALAVGDKFPAAQKLVDVTLRWRKTGSAQHVVPRLRLVQNGRTWITIGSSLFEHDYPVEQWVIDELVIERQRLLYPPVRGETALQIGQGDQWLTIATLKLDETALQFNAPSMAHSQAARFGEVAELSGYDLKSESMAADRPLVLTLQWRAINREPITTTYTVFAQLIAPDGHLVAQYDAPPDPPTTAWVPEQIILDLHVLKIVDTTYYGPATLIVGWYNSASIVRVPVATGGDFVTLNTPIQVEER